VWDAALVARWRGSPGVVPRRRLERQPAGQERQVGWVIDFGTSGVGDPACDLVIAWTMFWGNSRDKFGSAVPQDAATWARARGWALWKALIGLTGNVDATCIRFSIVRSTRS
jgi:aminoglycoside phosphotransferase (APT) family kinase protein